MFSEVIPAVQVGVARRLQLPDPATTAFLSNTHEVPRRLPSVAPLGLPIRVLTTDAEFHSARRQLGRFGRGVPPCRDARVCGAFRDVPHPLRRRSARRCRCGVDHQGSYTSGGTCGDLSALTAAIASLETLLVIDGYHGYLARPTDLSGVAARAFYMSSGYKCAMAGKDVCFRHCQSGRAPRPRGTGWFADFGALAAPPGNAISYPADGGRFLGATFGPIGLYR